MDPSGAGVCPAAIAAANLGHLILSAASREPISAASESRQFLLRNCALRAVSCGDPAAGHPGCNEEKAMNHSNHSAEMRRNLLNKCTAHGCRMLAKCCG